MQREVRTKVLEKEYLERGRKTQVNDLFHRECTALCHGLCFDLTAPPFSLAYWHVMARSRAGCAAACSESYRNQLIRAEKEEETMKLGRNQ